MPFSASWFLLHAGPRQAVQAVHGGVGDGCVSLVEHVQFLQKVSFSVENGNITFFVKNIFMVFYGILL